MACRSRSYLHPYYARGQKIPDFPNCYLLLGSHALEEERRRSDVQTNIEYNDFSTSTMRWWPPLWQSRRYNARPKCGSVRVLSTWHMTTRHRSIDPSSLPTLNIWALMDTIPRPAMCVRHLEFAWRCPRIVRCGIRDSVHCPLPHISAI